MKIKSKKKNNITIKLRPYTMKCVSKDAKEKGLTIEKYIEYIVLKETYENNSLLSMVKDIWHWCGPDKDIPF